MSDIGAQMPTNIRCQNHPTVDAFFVCLEQGCSEALACHMCIVNFGCHFKHNITLLDDHIGVFQTRIHYFTSNIRENVLVPLKNNVKKTEDDLKESDTTGATLIRTIEAREEKIVNGTSALVVELKAKCSQIVNSNRQGLEHYKERLVATVTEIEADLAAVESCLLDGHRADIVNAAKTMLDKSYEGVGYPSNIQEMVFMESDRSLSELSKLLGTLQIGHDEQDS